MIVFDEQCQIQNPEAISKLRGPQRERLNLEMLFHEQTWWLLQESKDQKLVAKERVYILFRILQDPNSLNYK